MKNLSLLVALTFITLLSGCSTTPEIIADKKPLTSDHMLMMSLLNRPITQDQKMMLAFAEQRTELQSPYFVNAIEIKGEKSSDTQAKAPHIYSRLIAQDFNSVRISGPK